MRFLLFLWVWAAALGAFAQKLPDGREERAEEYRRLTQKIRCHQHPADSCHWAKAERLYQLWGFNRRYPPRRQRDAIKYLPKEQEKILAELHKITTEAIIAHPRCAWAHYLRGMTFYAQDNPREALAALLLADSLQHPSATLYLTLSSLAQAPHAGLSATRAAELLEHGLENLPDALELYPLAIRLLETAQQPQRCEMLYLRWQNAATQQPSHAPNADPSYILAQRGAFWMRRQRYPEALADYTWLTAQLPCASLQLSPTRLYPHTDLFWRQAQAAYHAQQPHLLEQALLGLMHLPPYDLFTPIQELERWQQRPDCPPVVWAACAKLQLDQLAPNRYQRREHTVLSAYAQLQALDQAQAQGFRAPCVDIWRAYAYELSERTAPAVQILDSLIQARPDYLPAYFWRQAIGGWHRLPIPEPQRQTMEIIQQQNLDCRRWLVE